MKNFETSLTNFLIIIIIVFLVIGINMLSDINREINIISNNINTITNNTYATLCNAERRNENNVWTEEKYKKVRTNLDVLWKLKNKIK